MRQATQSGRTVCVAIALRHVHSADATGAENTPRAISLAATAARPCSYPVEQRYREHRHEQSQVLHEVYLPWNEFGAPRAQMQLPARVCSGTSLSQAQQCRTTATTGAKRTKTKFGPGRSRLRNTGSAGSRTDSSARGMHDFQRPPYFPVQSRNCPLTCRTARKYNMPS